MTPVRLAGLLTVMAGALLGLVVYLFYLLIVGGAS